jgi:predicted ArsR family transcriptional regulator
MLDTFRRAKGSGRPEKLYRITTRLNPLFTDGGPDLALNLLGAAQSVFGETAAAKLLYTLFQAKSDAWASKLAAHDTLEAKAKALARLRTADGCISAIEQDAQTGALSLVEHHHPLREIASEHEIVDELDCELIERLLNCEVSRTVEETSGLVRITFRLIPR